MMSYSACWSLILVNTAATCTVSRDSNTKNVRLMARPAYDEVVSCKPLGGLIVIFQNNACILPIYM